MKKIYFVFAGFTLFVTSFAWAQSVLPEVPPVPEDNPMSEAKVNLGKQLYFDGRLSQTGIVSCNSCHNVMGSGTDNKPVSTGINGKKGGRNAPTVWNAAFMNLQFWDGRAPTLEEQAKGPMVNPVEMGMANHDEVVKRLEAIEGYVQQFKAVYGGSKPVTIDNIAKAIAAYERTLLTPKSPYDRFMKGDHKALTPAAQRGLKLTQTVGCVTCHNGPLFAGPVFMKFPTFPNTAYEKKYNLAADRGRYEATKADTDKHMWRVPTWRNVALTAPYFHNGSVKTLDEAVRVMAKTQLNRDLTATEVSDIVAFLNSLTGERPRQVKPALPR